MIVLPLVFPIVMNTLGGINVTAMTSTPRSSFTEKLGLGLIRLAFSVSITTFIFMLLLNMIDFGTCTYADVWFIFIVITF